MKKKMKRIAVAIAIRKAIDDSMRRHPYYNREYYPCDLAANDCAVCNHCRVAPFVLTFFDASHTLICTSWLDNSFTGFADSESENINKVSVDLDLDISRLMWGRADQYLHLIRYIRVGIRHKNLEGDDIIITESGREYAIFGGNAIKRYVESWTSEWRRSTRHTR